MSARTSFCSLALAAAWLLLTPKPTPAQAPPGETTDQRLRRLEEKIDQLLGSRVGPKPTDARSPPIPDGSGLALLNQAAEKLKQALEAAQRDWDAHVAQTPTKFIAPAPATVLLERLAKIEARRQQLQAEVTEAEQNHALIDQVYKKEGKGVALRTIAGKGVKIRNVQVAGETLDKQFMELTDARRRLAADLGPAHPQIRTLDEQIDLLKKFYAGLGPGGPPASEPKPTDPDVVPVILKAMKDETESNKQRLQAFNREFEALMKDALELYKHEPERLRLKSRLDDAHKDLETVLHAIREIESPRPPK
jgi:hypothetical protein